MVLQCDLSVLVWGWAKPGEKVTVSLAGQSKNVVADESGRWQVKLDALKANAEGQGRIEIPVHPSGTCDSHHLQHTREEKGL